MAAKTRNRKDTSAILMCNNARTNWEDVRMLLVMVEVRNLHEAGQRLGVDRSTVSRRLSGLERQLGTRLFTRTRDGLRPTSAAERIRPFAERMAADATAVEQAAQSGREKTTGVVRVATTEAISTLLVDRSPFITRRVPGLARRTLERKHSGGPSAR